MIYKKPFANFKQINQHRKTFNINAHFISANPPTSFNKKSIYPNVDESVYVGAFSSIIGDVRVEKNVFIAPNVSIRADEGSPFFIDSNTNLQDGVILHGLEHGRIIHNTMHYSIYIGKHVSCAHGCMIHGPCKIGNNVFIGFNTIIFNAIIGDSCYVSMEALVTGGIKLRTNRFVPTGAVIDTQEKADNLGEVPKNENDFAKEVQKINNEFPSSYSMMFGNLKCSCGVACSSDTMKEFLV